jgi:5-methylthioadenosine/S-adenosylhomocysteine deaminase
MLVKNARFVVTPGGILENHDILIEDGRITRTAKGLKPAGEVVDASGKLVMPGLVNTHTHSPMVLFRGAGDDMPLMEWLEKKIWPMEEKLTEDDLAAGMELALLEMIRSGTTSFCDMYWFSEGAVGAVKKAGIKAVLSWALVDKERTSQKGDPLRLAEGFIRKWKGDPLVKPSVGPHAIYTCSKETLSAAKSISEKHGVVNHVHLSETRKEVDDSMKKNGLRPAEYLRKINFFTNRTLAAHSVWLNDGEINILARTGVSVSHCPASNMKLASGVMPLSKLQKAGVNVSLGTDGAASNNTLDMFDTMRLAALLHKVGEMDPLAAKASDVLKMATVNGAKALGINSGEIKPGKDADILILDINKAHWKPTWDVVSNLVYSAKSTDVETVIANGKVVMDKGRVMGLDQGKVFEEAEKVKARFV